MKLPTYRIHDTKVWLDFNKGLDPAAGRALWHRSLNHLAAHGWTIGKDPEIEAYYKCLSPTHRKGQQGDLHVQLSAHGARLDFDFWQDRVIEPGRTNSGRYSFNQRQLMPYLIRLQWQKTVHILTTFWQAEGILQNPENIIDETPMVGMPAVLKQMRGWKWHTPKDYDPCTFTSTDKRNTTTRDGHTILPGQVYAFYHRRRLHQGRAFYSLNNNWLMLTNEASPPLAASTSDIYLLRSNLPRRQPVTPRDRVERAQSRLERLVKKQAFEQAISVRDFINSQKQQAA